jgi:uncharacterized protein YacL
MSSKGWGARIVFLLVLGLVGTLAFKWWMGFVGLGIGAAAIALEILFLRLPAEDIAYALVGTGAGLVLGILVVLVLKLANVDLSAGESGDPMVMVPLALCFALGHVAVRKGRRLGLLETGEKEPVQRMPLVVDLSAIIDGRVADMILVGLLNGPFIIPASVETRLEDMKNSDDIVERGKSRRGLETLERLEESCRSADDIQYKDFGEGPRENLRLLEWLRDEPAKLLSADEDLLDTAEREGIHAIRLDEIGGAAKRVILPGERVRLKLIRKGRNPGQGVGFLNDGTMVVVEDGENDVSQVVDAITHTTFRASGGTMVFARKATEESFEEHQEVTT